MKLSLLHRLIPGTFIAKLEAASQSRLPRGLTERLLSQMGVCFQKPGVKLEVNFEGPPASDRSDSGPGNATEFKELTARLSDLRR